MNSGQGTNNSGQGSNFNLPSACVMKPVLRDHRRQKCISRNADAQEIIQPIRCGVVGNIYGSHPCATGSIPGSGIAFTFCQCRPQVQFPQRNIFLLPVYEQVSITEHRRGLEEIETSKACGPMERRLTQNLQRNIFFSSFVFVTWNDNAFSSILQGDVAGVGFFLDAHAA